MTARTQPVTLCGTPLLGVRHVCTFFDSRAEQYDHLNPYFREGLALGETVVTIVESALQPDHEARMRAGGVPVQAAKAFGQLLTLASEDTYIQDDAFEAERMYRLVERTLQEAERGPFKSVRTFGDMEWALRSLPGTEDLMAYEARLNDLAAAHDCTLLCGYDLQRFNSLALADVLATHTHVLMGGRLYENPEYVEPKAFLERLVRRREQGVAIRAAG